jgi:N utilization substance protein A
MTQKISVVIDDQDFPAVVGKRGANSRLNSQLIEREIEIWKMSEYSKFISDQCMKWAASDDHTLDETIESIPQINPLVVQSIVDSGYDTLRKILATQPEELAKSSGISLDVANKILEEIRKQRM